MHINNMVGGISKKYKILKNIYSIDLYSLAFGTLKNERTGIMKNTCMTKIGIKIYIFINFFAKQKGEQEVV